MNKKGFTLIEILAVIIILGVLIMIAIPSVTNIMVSSRKSIYQNNIKSMMDEVSTKYIEKYYGPYIDDNQVMMVPISLIKFDKNNSNKSPFGNYNFKSSYIIVRKETTDGRSNYKIYATVIDSTNQGVKEAGSEKGVAIKVKKLSPSSIPTINSYFKCSGTNYEPVLTNPPIFSFKGTDYEPVEARGSLAGNCGTANNYPVIIFREV